MNTTSNLRTAALMALMWSTVGGTAQANEALDGRGHFGHPQRGDAEVIIEWNALLESVLPAGGLAPPRHYAMLHVAMFDAINSIERTHRPYRVAIAAPRGGSPEIAAAQAARDILAAQFPSHQTTFDKALAARIGKSYPHQVYASTKVGKAVAAAVLTWRADDGWSDPPEPYAQPELPGLYQPTAPSFGPSLFRQFANVPPFALLTTTQYLPAPAPTLTSERYAEDFNEVKAVGAVNSTVRTAEQTQLAQLFANVTSSTVHWPLWNHVTRDTVRENRLSLIETARAFTLVNVAIHDAVQTSHSGKYIYGLWRPITAIQKANDDLNPATAQEDGWMPLLETPRYPSHPGNMACVGASAARMLQLIHGTDEVSFTAKWKGTTPHPDVARPYQSFWQLAVDQANSRIYGGIHFRFESEASQASCPKIAEFIFSNYMRAKRT